MKLLLIAAPILTFALFVLVRALVGRPLSRFVLNVAVALFLLAYVLVTAALGIFWVARMDLPAFDLHYLFGYCVVLLVVVHLSFQLKILATFVRRVSPRALLVADGTALRPRLKRALAVLGIVVVLAALGWFLVGAFAPGPAALVVVSPVSASASDSRLPTTPELFIERKGGRISAFDYLHEQSSYSRAGILRSLGLAPERPLEVKSYAGAENVALPAPRARAGVRFGAAAETAGGRIVAERRETPSLGDVAELFHYATGVTSKNAAAGLLLRAAASSGALYPVDLYVVARDVSGLEPGTYYYEPQKHALARVSRELEALPEALAEPELARAAPFVFVAAVTFDRTVVKYNVRSYRYVALDAGHVVANLSLVASALGYGCKLETAFDDERLGRALALDPDDEAALLVAICDRSPATSDHTIALPDVEPPALPERPDELELTRLSHRLTSWHVTKGAPRRANVVRRPASTAPGLALPRAEPVAQDLFETIALRRSFREFRDAPIRLSELAAVAYDATHAVSPLRGAPLVDLHVLVARVEGLAPGAYRFDRERALLEPRARDDRSSAIQSAALSQEVLGRAAVVLAWTLTETAGTIDGTRDYRTANLEAGLSGEVAYLSATARGLGICGVGAYYDSEVDALLEHGASRPRTLYLQGLGAR